MKKNEIKVGGRYKAKVNGNLVTVRVDAINESGFDDRTTYAVTNLATGRKTTFRSAAKFRDEAEPTGGQHTAPESADCPPLPPVNALSGPGDDTPSRLNARPVSGLMAKLAKPAPNTAPHVIVEARAGTGKTTTLVAALQVLKGQTPTDAKGNPIAPSPQQKAVWDAVALSRDAAKTVGFVAFNKSIAEELKRRVPAGCEAMTMHSLGYKAVTKAFGRCEPTSWRVTDLICEILERDVREVRRSEPTLLSATEALVSLCKMNLVGADWSEGGDKWADELDRLAEHYDVDLNGCRSRVFDLVPQVLEKCKDVRGKIDFDDMIWLPVVLNLPVQKFDLLMVDEAQDLNRCQQELAKRAGSRLVLCGDPRQAIYGFAGADAESMPRMGRELSETDVGRVTLPLTVTRRCGKAIVEEARKIVPDFEAHETNPAGKISAYHYETEDPLPNRPAAGCYRTHVEDGNMVLCRANAPLVRQCFKFIKAGRKATIQGRDIGKGLTTLVEKLCKEPTAPVTELIARLDDWLAKETAKEQAKRHPSEDRLQGLEDKHSCLSCFCDGSSTVADVRRRIDAVFTEDKNAPGIRLSSIHKAKGLEASRVFLLQPEGKEVMPKWLERKPEWEREQARNLLYVAITRAVEELVYVA